MHLHSIVSVARSAAVQVYTDGNVTLKAGASGFAILFTAFSETASSLFFAVLCLFWAADMLSGLLRAIAAGGLGRFSWVEFFGGFIKMAAAGVGIAVAVGIDQIGVEKLEMTRQYATNVAMSGIAFAFAASAVENLSYWFPSMAGQLAKILNRGETTPDIADPRMRLKDLPSETRARIRSMLADERPSS